MAGHNELGKKGEKVATGYLKEKGYEIIEKNWRYDRKEIDIIAKKGEYLVIVEVKTRSTDYYEKPEESVTFQKQKFLIEAAEAYIEKYNINLNTRFDVISIVFQNGKPELNHIQFAFYPGMDE